MVPFGNLRIYWVGSPNTGFRANLVNNPLVPPFSPGDDQTRAQNIQFFNYTYYAYDATDRHFWNYTPYYASPHFSQIQPTGFAV